MNKILLIILLFCLTFYQNDKAYCYHPVYVQQNMGYVTDLNLALKLSKETQQEVLLIFSASWCQFCTTLKNDLIKLDNLDNKIICIVDTDEEKKLTRQFKVKTLPSSFILDKSGEILSSKNGYDFNTYNEWLAR